MMYINGIELSPHYNAEIIYIDWDYLNIRWFGLFFYVYDLRLFNFSPFSQQTALFYFLGIDWHRGFVSLIFVVFAV